MSQPDHDSLPLVLPWQCDQWADWQRLLEIGRLPHAVLITGLPGLGKGRLARAFAQAVLCQDSSVRPCGRCKSCRLLAAETHPDLRILEPQEAGKGIKIQQVRELMDFLGGTAQQGGWKCAIIEPADAMNSHAANALLKSLEEPPGDTLIVLATATPGRLMATLRSRCRHVQVHPPTRSDALEWLQPRVGRQAEALLDYAHGAPCAALAANDEDRLLQREEVFGSLLALAQARLSTPEAARTIQACGDSEALDQFLTLVSRLSRAGLAAGPDCEELAGEWKAVLGRIRPQHLFRYADKLLQAKSLLLSGANPNKQLLWEELLLDWQALTAARATARPARPLI
ncbi:DNA polymerase III subunit delta' [Proteobacteria bacterium 005FR1]|nr:DNA polymerase III subunit delta' [Proteobacteria bacterium 005FR1]